MELNAGDVLEVGSKIASIEGKEFSRARWAALVFQPADNATTKGLAAMKPASSTKVDANPSPAK